MRLWSLHPSYLDAKGLVALWREALLARAVLMGKTKGYKNHPQLIRFRACVHPVRAIDEYLWGVYAEAERRKYHFNKGKLSPVRTGGRMPVTNRQLRFERMHLEEKLKVRARESYNDLRAVKRIRPHPTFRIVRGGVEEWEKQPRAKQITRGKCSG